MDSVSFHCSRMPRSNNVQSFKPPPRLLRLLRESERKTQCRGNGEKERGLYQTAAVRVIMCSEM